MDNLENLSHLLYQSEKRIISDNERSMYDINKLWEKIAMYILNITYDWNLQDLNLVRKNFPGIDLGDRERHIGVQVTKDSSINKINTTFKKLKENHIDGRPISEDYYNIYFFILGKKQETYPKQFDIKENFVFTQDWIIDFEDYKNIFCSLDDEKQETILKILNRELCKKPKYQLNATPNANCDFIIGSRCHEMEEIDREFEKSNQVFLWGMPGIGKTELAAEWGRQKENAYLVHYKKSIMETVLDMDFGNIHYVPSKKGMTDQQKKEEEFQQRLDILSEYYRDAVIIIDNFDDEEHKLTLAQMQNCPDYKALIRLKNKFLFTTRFEVRKSAVHVKEMDMKSLLELIKQNYDLFKEEDQDVLQVEGIQEGEYDEIFKKLIQIVDLHTLTVDLMSKTLYESYGRITPERLLKIFEENELNHANMPMVPAYHNSQDSDYDFKECRMYEHLKLIFDLAELGEPHKNVMRHAVLLPMEGMPMILFRDCHTKEEQDALETKILHRSWLRLNRTHTIISIHAVIRKVCRIELQPDDDNCSQFLFMLRKSEKADYKNQELIKPIADIMGNAAEYLPDKEGIWNRTAGNEYRFLGNYRKAVEYLRKAIEKHLQEDMDLADLYSDIGNTYTNLKEFENSIFYHEKSLAICGNIKEINYQKLAKRYNDLGLAYSYRAEREKSDVWFQKAIECYKVALKINEEAGDDRSLYVSNIYNNIGNTYSNIGKIWHQSSNYGSALEYHRKALEIRETMNKEIPMYIARSYKNIGNDHANLKDNVKALQYRKKALDKYKNILHGEHPELAAAYQDVGNTYRLTQDFDKALEYYFKAERIWKKNLPQNDIELAKCEEAIGMIYFERSRIEENEKPQKAQEDYNEAIAYCKSALNGYEKYSKLFGRQIKRCKGKIGEIYLKFDKREDAIKFFKEKVSIQPQNATKKSKRLLKEYHRLGEVSKKEKNFTDALACYIEILEIRESYFSKEYRNLMETNFEIACIYRDLRKPQMAMSYLEKALQICETYFLDDRKYLHRLHKTMEITNGELKKLSRQS